MCIYDVLVDHGNFDKLLQLIDANDGIRTLLVEEDGPFTLFAPTDSAFVQFEKFLSENETSLVAVLANNEMVGKLLSNHLLEDELTREDLEELNDQSVTFMNGHSVKINSDDPGNILIDESIIEESDLLSSNGVVHIIDTILMPDNLVI